ncbi:MAG: excinuclease ABC subunit UvrA [Clostridia bacterium]|nr:excinuclease ABC subunit UvrA [Clostridia bacterium]
MLEDIIIKGARENNLKNIDIVLPRNKLIVFTGLSGSGKSSLAFDTIYAEGQRRYVESLSSYARQFLGQMSKPDVDSIDGLSPAIAIDQKSTSSNPRSTVGTVTEINDYLRLLYARIGLPHCVKCGKPISKQSIDQVVDNVMELDDGVRIQIIAPLVRNRKGEYQKLIEGIRRDGYMRVKLDGVMYDIDSIPPLTKNQRHTIDVVVDRLVMKREVKSRLTESLETAFRLGGGLSKVEVLGGEEKLYSQNYSCSDCNISIEELAPRMFSFNNPYGACPHCTGLGYLLKMDAGLIVANPGCSLNDNAIDCTGWQSGKRDSIARSYFVALAEEYGFSLDTPWNELPEEARNAVLYGTGDRKLTIQYEREYGAREIVTAFEGIVGSLERRYRETTSEYMKKEYERYMSEEVCPVCHGKRLRPETLAVTVGGKSIAEACDMTIIEITDFINALELSDTERLIAESILKEVKSRLGFLVNVGLDYLTLSRASSSLSGGEAQRIRLATQIGSGLVGVVYILDEPSIGLHQRDNSKLLDALKRMRDLGNTLIVVEHDEETMRAADHIVDIGPFAGERGGYVVADGTLDDIMRCEDSIIGQYLSGSKCIPVPSERRALGDKWLKVRGARANNLCSIDVDIPLGAFTCVTGVSGSGKSSLVNEIVRKTLLRDLNRARVRPADCDSISGIEHLDKIIDIDQSPIGRTPRSNPATYTGLFDLIRELYAMTADARSRGYISSRFSFNVRGGRCEACKGDGIIKIEMHFLPDVYIPCEVCKGKRYNRETLEVKYKGKSIADVLDMRVEDACEFFSSQPRITKKLQTLLDVGLGYIRLGQPSTTLSGGEAQRVKLATELSRRDTGRTFYVLDEPTTGLHTDDVARLLSIFDRLCANGSTVMVIEHNLDVIKTADYLIDLGPEGGNRGGRLVACGTPEEVAGVAGSYTGQYLGRILSKGVTCNE